METKLKGRTYLITGGAGTIGLATARCFLEEGSKVAVADLPELRDSTEVAGLAEQYPSRLEFVDLDLTREESIQPAVSAVLSKFGAIHGIVNNAAVFSFSALEKWESMRALDRHYEVGLRGAMALVQSTWLQCPASRSGSVVTISSVAGHVGEPDAFAYTPIKAAQKGLTLSCAMEMAPHDGWAVTISPGHTWNWLHERRAKAEGLSRRDYEKNMPSIQSTLFGRFLEPAEVAKWIVLASSPLGKALSGQDIRVSFGIEAGGFNSEYKTGH